MMAAIFSRKIIWIILLLVAVIGVFTYSTHTSTIDFNTQVKPIFNKKCIACHGGVKRKADFSLLFRSEALAPTESGRPAIIPGKPDESELIRRLTLKDPEERMPYKHDALTNNEIEILRNWIKQGAKWGDHWAYVPVKSEPAPHIENEWIQNDIDKFIYEKIADAGLQPSPKAAKEILLRRVSLDLIGMPAPDTIACKFLNNNTPVAYQTLVNDLLATPQYGEKWASLWLDLARYADTKGYERDDSRSIWHYRDWLINAFNNDKPYNVFLTEQLAGDLLPNATDEQLVATAFHRNTMTNDEGGTENEEFRTAATLDRVNTTWEALMGTTFACVQCHSHPYDPFTHDEYYKFLAFFNNSRDEDTYADYPLLRHFNDSAVTVLNKVFEWVKNNASLQEANAAKLFLKTQQPALNSLTCDEFINSELNDTKWLAFRKNAQCRLKNAPLQNSNEIIFTYMAGVNGGVWNIYLDKPGGEVIATIPLPKTNGWQTISAPVQKVNGVHNLYFTYTNKSLKDTLQNAAMFDWFYFTNQFPGAGKQGYAAMKKSYWQLLTMQTPTTPVMMENPLPMQRKSFVFERGNWLVKGKEVTAAVPHALNKFPANAPANRLGLAMWLTDKKNPLTARTMVNRLWEQLYGVGIAETLEDLGTQGITPTHKALLNWLSYYFMNDAGWSVKKMLKLMVMSATYQQDSKVTKQLAAKDPANKLYARAPRVRLSAEQVRDQGLAISGVYNNKMFGASVFPYQPKGIWLSPWNGAEWKESEGENKYRRAIYTYWKRTAPYPTMMLFDGAAREVCTSRRIRTNTPLQALATLNDEACLDMSRHFAYRMQKKAGATIDEQINEGYKLIFYKPVTADKLAIFKKLYNTALSSFKSNADKTCEMIGEMNEYNNAPAAALVVVANAMLNLDEVMTKN
jgi:Protein of unknown function (DUF1553)/Protein of unknown function (DUF1549)/Planctomycete cytochrome C/Carbohydrate binding module (family 6)